MSNQTENKRYLFRGFHPDEKKSTIITLNGEKIKGEWVYGSLIKQTKGRNSSELRGAWIVDYDTEFEVIPETIGQWVRLDKNGKDVFVGDRMAFKNPSYENIETGEVIYNEEDLSFELASDRDRLWDLFGYADEFYEIIGNKWEVKL